MLTAAYNGEFYEYQVYDHFNDEVAIDENGKDVSIVSCDYNEIKEWREKVDSYWERELGIKDFSPRKALQMIGTNVMRNHFDEAFWIKALKRKL